MKRFLLTLTAALTLFPIQPATAKPGASRSHSSKPKNPKASKKSQVPGSKDGHYAGGVGSSHKGGHYKNATTGNKERNRKAGVTK